MKKGRKFYATFSHLGLSPFPFLLNSLIRPRRQYPVFFIFFTLDNYGSWFQHKTQMKKSLFYTFHCCADERKSLNKSLHDTETSKKKSGEKFSY